MKIESRIQTVILKTISLSGKEKRQKKEARRQKNNEGTWQ